MKKIIFLIVFQINLVHAQDINSFMSEFIEESILIEENKRTDYPDLDFSSVWLKTPTNFVRGIIGDEHQRIRIKLLSIQKDSTNETIYNVVGKSMVKNNICDFTGVIKTLEVKEFKTHHYGVDNKFQNDKIKKQGLLISRYTFWEDEHQKHTGIFVGKLYTKWYLDSNNIIQYDDIQSFSDGYSNNAYIGVWEGYGGDNIKKCNWADFRVPMANQDFDIGAGEFYPNEKYRSKGWEDFYSRDENNIYIEWWKK